MKSIRHILEGEDYYKSQSFDAYNFYYYIQWYWEYDSPIQAERLQKVRITIKQFLDLREQFSDHLLEEDVKKELEKG